MAASMARTLVPTLALAMLAGCSSMSLNMGAADFGVTPGGSQDIGYARDMIAGGQIPDQEHYTAEGLFSEHDLPLDGPPCEALLCPRTAVTLHEPAEGEAKALVQLGFGTNVSPATFERADQDLVLLVDVSGSMSGHLELAKDAMLDVVDGMGPGDRVGLVEFGNRAKGVERSRPMDERGKRRLRDAIEDLSTNGSTDMESGMREAYAQLDPDHPGMGRLMIFSDAQPNTGVTEDSAFVELVRDHADDGVGTTFIGLGRNLGTELQDVISKVRGGNAYFLSEDNKAQLFVEDLDFMLTPLAYDLQVEMRALEGVPLGDEVYGAPVDGDAVAFGASSLFLSRSQGGMAATFDVVPDAPMSLGTMEVSYLPVGASAPVTEAVGVRWDGGTYGDADDVGVYKIDALVHMVKALDAAAEACDDEPRPVEDARAVVAHARTALDEAATTLDGDADLTREVALLDALDALLAEPTLSCAEPDTGYY